MATTKSKLSITMLGVLAAGATAPVLMSQFQDEKEETSLISYPDTGGVMRVNGKPVIRGMALTREQCDKIDKAEQAKALEWMAKNVRIPLSKPLKVGIVSFCPWNIGPGKCLSSTFYRKLNSGDRQGHVKR